MKKITFLSALLCASLALKATPAKTDAAKADTTKADAKNNIEIKFKLERSQPALLERFEVRYNKDNSLDLSLNTNVFCGPAKQVWLGLFKVPAQKMLQLDKSLLYHASIRLPSKPIQFQSQHPHATRYFLNRHNVSGQLKIKRTINSALNAACETQFWQAQKAVQVKALKPKAYKISKLSAFQIITRAWRQLEVQHFVAQKKQRTTYTTYEQAKCRKVGQTKADKLAVIECLIDNYGQTLLIDPYF